MTACSSIGGLLAAVSLTVSASVASAQFSALNLHPAGATDSKAMDVRNGQEVGYARFGAPVDAAIRWTGSAASYLNLGPGYILATDGVQHGGVSYNVMMVPSPNTQFWGGAVTWSGATPGVQYDLTPQPVPVIYNGAGVYGVFAGEQVGYAVTAGFNASTAALWTNSGSSYTNLNPAWAVISTAYSTHMGQQAGWASGANGQHATIWYGSAASAIDINPPNATKSIAYDNYVVGGLAKQVGFATYPSAAGPHATLWTSSAGSAIDMHPSNPTITESVLNGIWDNYEVGYVVRNGIRRATLWTGSNNNAFTDLHTLIGAGYVDSTAEDVWVSPQNYIYVAGWATNVAGNTEAFLWTTAPVPEPAGVTAAVAAAGGLAALPRRARRN